MDFTKKLYFQKKSKSVSLNTYIQIYFWRNIFNVNRSNIG